MDTTSGPFNNDNSDSGTSKSIPGVENSRLMGDNRTFARGNPIQSLNPPPPLPGIFLFDTPIHQQNSSHRADIIRNVTTESCNKNVSNLSSSMYSVPFGKVTHCEQGAYDKMHINSNIHQPSPTQATVSERTDSMLPADTGIHHIQSLEPVTVNAFEDPIQSSSETKVYHQLHAISPNDYKLEEESKLYHEMSPVSLTSSTLPKDEYVAKHYQQLKPVPVIDDPPRTNLTFQELKPVIPHYYDSTEYVSSKLYQQLQRPQAKEEKPKYNLDIKKYQQLRPVTVVDFERATNKKSQQTPQQQFPNNPENMYPVSPKSKTESFQGVRASVINKASSQITRHTIPDTKNSHLVNESLIGFKEDKPKVYLELRNPSIRSQLQNLPKSEHFNNFVSSPQKTQYPDTPPKYENTNVPTTQGAPHINLPRPLPRVQKTPEFKLPGPYEFNLPQQNSPNKYKLPKILGPNEYSSPELILKPMEKNHESNFVRPFGSQKVRTSMIPSSSTNVHRQSSFNGMRSKVPLSLPRTPLCYGDPGINNTFGYYPDKATFGGNLEPSVVRPDLSYFEKQSQNSAFIQNSSNSVQMNGPSRLREELLKPKTVVRKICMSPIEGNPLKEDNNSQCVNVKDQVNLKIADVSREANCAEKLVVGGDSPFSKNTIDEQFNKPKLSQSNLNPKGIEKATVADDTSKKSEQLSKNLTLSEAETVQIPETINKESETSENVVLNTVDNFDQLINNMNSVSDKKVIKENINKFPVGTDDHLNSKSSKNSMSEKSQKLSESCKSESSCALLNEGPAEVISESTTETVNEQPLESRHKEDEGSSILQVLDTTDKKPVSPRSKDNINDNNTDKVNIDNTDEFCCDDINKSSIQEDFVKTSKECISKSIISHDLKEEQQLLNNSVESLIKVTENSSALINSESDCINSLSLIQEEDAPPEVKQKSSDGKELKVKRKYTKRIVPENESRKHMKRKASWGLKDIIKREKRRYTKRNAGKVNEFSCNEDKPESIVNEMKEIKREKRKYTKRNIAKIWKSAKDNKDKSESIINESIVNEVKEIKREKRKYTKRNIAKIWKSAKDNTDKPESINNESIVNEVKEIKREKRKYTKRNITKIWKYENYNKLNYNEESSESVDNESIVNEVKGIICDKRNYTKSNITKTWKSEKGNKLNYNEEQPKSILDENIVNEVKEIKLEALTEDEENINDNLRPSVQVREESAPRKKRKYTKKKTKNEGPIEQRPNYNERVKRKYTKHRVSEETIRERKKKPSVRYEFIDPLEEGLTTDDDGEAVFLGFDMTDEENETILGFEIKSEEEPENDFQLLTKLEDADCVTIECDPRSLLQPSANTVSCSQCNQSFESHMDLVTHMQRHTASQPRHKHPHVCTVCLRGFSSQVQLDRHIKWTHKGGKKHKCAKCPKMFTTKAYAKRHAATAHKVEEIERTTFYCRECSKTFQTEAKLTEHENNFHKKVIKEENMEINTYCCGECSAAFQTESKLKEHENQVHKKTAFKEEEMKITTFYCGECSLTFKTEAKLKKHESKVHKKTLFQCEKCLKYFQKFSNLQKHKLTHVENSEGQAFPCAYCNQKFSSRESLHAHWPVHTDKKVYTCDICNSKFTALNSLKRHRILHAGEKLFRCEICQRSFSLLSTLKTHLLIHTGARRFECNLCGKTFNRRDVLNAHQWVHTGEKKFQCDICFQKFRWRHAVRSHKLIYHSTEKPYACQICGKRFSHPDSFKKHAEVHAERLFYCQICLKAFSRASTLKAHITTHTDLKPFFCDKCHRGFRSKSHLRNHFLVHTKEKPWLCKFCNKTYKDRTQLRRHKRVVHCKAFYSKILPNFSGVYKNEETLEMEAVTQQGEYENQLEQSLEENDTDPSGHFISLPVEVDLPKVEENIVPPSVF